MKKSVMVRTTQESIYHMWGIIAGLYIADDLDIEYHTYLRMGWMFPIMENGAIVVGGNYDYDLVIITSEGSKPVIKFEKKI